MPSPHEKIMAFVEKELKKNPKASATELYEKARKVSRNVAKLNVRQFHAKYPLQVKRKLARKKPRKPRTKKQPAATTAAPASDREAIRKILLDFAKDIAGAQEQTQMIDVMAKLDRYVDRIAQAAG